MQGSLHHHGSVPHSFQTVWDLFTAPSIERSIMDNGGKANGLTSPPKDAMILNENHNLHDLNSVFFKTLVVRLAQA